MTQEPDRVIEESQLRKILLKAYQLKCDELAHQRQVTEDAEVRLMAMNARLAAQSGYAENEEQADLQAALIAQYDAIVAAVPQWDVIGPSANDSPASEAFRDGWLIGWKAHLILTLDAIAKHDPRKGAE